MTEAKKRPVLYILLFLFSFTFFLYLTFPYSVLKEAVFAEVAKATGYNIQIENFGPSLPVGFEGENLQISSKDGSQNIQLQEVDITISMLSLLIGRISIDADLVSKNKGELDLQVSWGILQLALDQNFIPSSIDIDADNFDVGSLATFGIQSYAKNANDLIKGTLLKMIVTGNLVGTAELDLAVDDPVQSSGVVNLKLAKAALDLNDEGLGVAKQNFKKADIRGSLEKGSLKINPKSGFVSQELSIKLKGKTDLRSPLPSSKLDLGIDVNLSGKLKENFDFVLSMAGGKDGGVKYKLSGTLGRPNFRAQ